MVPALIIGNVRVKMAVLQLPAAALNRGLTAAGVGGVPGMILPAGVHVPAVRRPKLNGATGVVIIRPLPAEEQIVLVTVMKLRPLLNPAARLMVTGVPGIPVRLPAAVVLKLELVPIPLPPAVAHRVLALLPKVAPIIPVALIRGKPALGVHALRAVNPALSGVNVLTALQCPILIAAVPSPASPNHAALLTAVGLPGLTAVGQMWVLADNIKRVSRDRTEQTPEPAPLPLPLATVRHARAAPAKQKLNI